MPQYDLNGNPIGDDPPAYGAPAAGPGQPQYDLAGNPVPGQPYTPPYPQPGPGVAPQPPTYAAPNVYPQAPNPYPQAPNAYGQAPTPYPQAPNAYRQAPTPYPQAPNPYVGPSPAAGYSGGQPASKGGGRTFEIVLKSIAGLLIVAVLGVAACIVVPDMYPPPVPAPTSYAPYTTDDGIYTMNYPAGWTISPIDKTQGTEEKKIDGGVVFTKGTARIEVAEGTPLDFDATGMEKVMQLSNADSDTPCDMAFLRYHRLATHWLAGYRQDDPIPIDGTAFRSAQQATFTADREIYGFGGPIKGYLTSESDHEISIVILCECRARDWDHLKGPFQTVINSIVTPQKPNLDPLDIGPPTPADSTPSDSGGSGASSPGDAGE
ncbi:MAG: hypothetical protein ACLQVD_13670 [Capsulimonadaceae bacterium]